MRFEPTLQPRFHRLVQDLELKYQRFVGPCAESHAYPSYDVTTEEQEHDALSLLRRGIMLIMGQDPDDQDWIDRLTEADYEGFRTRSTLGGKYLWTLGFWNALSSDGILSHQAVAKIRDTGTFYHMIPENLNAIEWTIWWLRALKTDGRELASIVGGSFRLIDALLVRLHAMANVELYGGQTLRGIQESDNDQRLLELTIVARGRSLRAVADRVILALPQMPLNELRSDFPDNIQKCLNTVVGFPMLKVFLVTDAPWWDREQPPQQFANRMPTRELHYFRRPDGTCDDGHGMVMLYTDRPATEYWKHYVRGDRHDRAEIDQNAEIVDVFANFVARDVKRALEQGHDSDLHLNDQAKRLFSGKTIADTAALVRNSIVSYGIRDWARAPVGAANHGWRPGVQSGPVRHSLKAFSMGSGRRNTHVCGEAYSDYHGFVEGALNSAELALRKIREQEQH